MLTKLFFFLFNFVKNVEHTTRKKKAPSSPSIVQVFVVARFVTHVYRLERSFAKGARRGSVERLVEAGATEGVPAGGSDRLPEYSQTQGALNVGDVQKILGVLAAVVRGKGKVPPLPRRLGLERVWKSKKKKSRNLIRET
jgi:hypothetical protein